jgi:hypothetical protein
MMKRREDYPEVICHECGRHDRAAYIEPTATQMIELRLCFNCLFWTEKIALAFGPDAHRIARIEGKHYSVGAKHPRGYRGFLGFGGSHFVIEWDDGRREETRNLWSQGPIPDRFRSRLPDNARFVTSTATTPTPTESDQRSPRQVCAGLNAGGTAAKGNAEPSCL